MGTHEHYLHPFISHDNILLILSEVNIYKKDILQYECKSRIKPGKDLYAAHEPRVGHPYTLYVEAQLTQT